MGGLIQPNLKFVFISYVSLISMFLIINIGYKKNWINKDEFFFAHYAFV